MGGAKAVTWTHNAKGPSPFLSDRKKDTYVDTLPKAQSPRVNTRPWQATGLSCKTAPTIHGTGKCHLSTPARNPRGLGRGLRGAECGELPPQGQWSEKTCCKPYRQFTHKPTRDPTSNSLIHRMATRTLGAEENVARAHNVIPITENRERYHSKNSETQKNRPTVNHSKPQQKEAKKKS